MQSNSGDPSATPRFPETRRISRRVLIFADDLVHVLVALLLVGATAVILLNSAKSFTEFSTVAMVRVINDGLLALIIMEILWTIIRYLGRQQFSLNPFLFIGIIAGVRRILSIEAEMSLGEQTQILAHTIELGVVSLMVLVLVVAYYIANRVLAEPRPD